jgi:hypothetical protein
MNERIRELAKQAGLVYEKRPELDVWTAFDSELKEFSRLLVKECIGKYDEWAEHSTDKTSFAMAQHAVKRHFGVD